MKLSQTAFAKEVYDAIPKFTGGHERYLEWKKLATAYAELDFLLPETRFNNLKKTLGGDALRQADHISQLVPNAVQVLIKKLD